MRSQTRGCTALVIKRWATNVGIVVGTLLLLFVIVVSVNAYRNWACNLQYTIHIDDNWGMNPYLGKQSFIYCGDIWREGK